MFNANSVDASRKRPNVVPLLQQLLYGMSPNTCAGAYNQNASHSLTDLSYGPGR